VDLRKLIEGRRKSAVHGRTVGVAAGAGTLFALRLIIGLSAATSVLRSVSILSLLIAVSSVSMAGCAIRMASSVRQHTSVAGAWARRKSAWPAAAGFLPTYSCTIVH